MLIPVAQQYSQSKNEDLTPYLYDVPSQVLRNGAVRFMRAMHGFWSGLAERPTYKKKSGRQPVWLTSELFQFKPTGKTIGKQDKTIYDHKLMLGTLTHSLGELCFKAHSEYALSASITITREAGKWFVSFSYKVAAFSLSEEELIAHYSALSEESLIKITHGMDRGVVVPVAVRDDTSHDFIPEQKQGLAGKEIRRKTVRTANGEPHQGFGSLEKIIQQSSTVPCLCRQCST
jgi:putative transposase